MKSTYYLILPVIFIGIYSSFLYADVTQENNVSNAAGLKTLLDACTGKIYKKRDAKAEVITWRDESAITILIGERTVLRKAYFSDSGYNGSFIQDGRWSPDGSYFAFRLLSSGGHMPYRNPVKIFHMDHNVPSLLDAEEIIAKIPGISNIAVGPHKEPYMMWLSESQLQVSVISQDKESDSGMYIIDLNTLSAKRYNGLQLHKTKASDDLTVPRGSPKRKTILNTLRQKMKQEQNLDVVFVVEYLKTEKGWAWIHVLPQSKDGKNHYEDVFALLNRRDGKWKVAEWACTDDEDPECIGNPKYFLNIKKHFPDLPEAILPQD